MKIIQQFLKRFGDARDPQMPPRHAAVTPAPLLMALEPRVVFDASVGAVAAHAHGAEADTHMGVAKLTDATAHAAPKTIAEHDVRHAKTLNDTATQTTATAKADTATQQQTTPSAAALVTAEAAPHTVVFIDPSVPNYQTLIAGLPAGTDHVVLNATTDGFAQMAGYLQTHKGVDSIQLISHGAAGEIQAGSTWLNSNDLPTYSAELTQIGAAIKPGGDFLIYGCDVAQSADGQLLVRQVAALTHLNVAASADATGASTLGGNWTLEYQVGTVHTAVVESAAAQQQFNALLGVTVETYDTAASNSFVANNTTSFTLDGVTYTTDQAVNTGAYNDSNAPYGPTNITDSTTDGVLEINVDGTAMTQMTITMASGKAFKLSSFDLDSQNGDLYIEANGDASTRVQISTAAAAYYTGTFSLASNPNFQNVTSVTFVDLNDTGNLTTSLDNLTYSLVGPSLTPSSGNATFTAGDNTASTPVAVDSGLTLTDSNATTAQSATISITNVKTGDELLYTPSSGISGVYSNGVLTLTGSATIAQWQNALESITFTNTQTTPDATTRSISFSITDSAGATTTASRNITVVDTDQTPILHPTGGATSYVAGAASTTIDSGLTVTDSDSANQASATVTIGNASTGDILNFTAGQGISGVYSTSTHTLTLTGTTTDAHWQTALDSVGFSSSVGAAGGARTISFQINDGTKNSAVVTKTINVSPVPIVTTDSGSASFVSGDNTTSTPVSVDSGLTLSENTGPGTLASATVQITGNFHTSEDSLLFTNNPATMGDISGFYSSSTGLLTLTSASHATLSQWQAALRSITYTDSATSPATQTRTVSFTANDGSQAGPVATRQITVTATDNTPIVTLSGSNSAYAAGSAATAIDSSISVTDRDNSTLASATVSISSGFQTGDTLSLANDGIVSSSYNAATGVLTLTAVGSVSTAQWATELDNVKFSSAANTPAGARTVSYLVNDGTKPSATVSRTVTVASLPVVNTDSGSASFVAGDNSASTPVAVDSGITVSDGGSSTLVSATVQITGNFHPSEDLLLFTNNPATMGDISGSYNSTTGFLTLNSASHATLAQWQAALRSIVFDDTAITPNSATRTISFTVNDGTNSSPTATRTVTVTDTDQTPILSTSGGSSGFVEADNTTSTPVVIDAGVTVSDLDNSTLAQASVAITGNLNSGEDVLAFNNTNAALFGNIHSTYNPSIGTLQMFSSSGTATVAQWQAALRAVTYTDTAITPNTATRTISFSVNDGSADSNVGTKAVTVAGVDQSPVLSASSGDFNYLPGNAAHTIDSGITLTDTDSSTLASLTVQVTSGFQSGDQLSLNDNSATMGNNFSITFDSVSGTLTATRTGAMTLANWQAIADNLQFSASPGVPTGTRTLSVVASDGVKDSNALVYNADVVSSAPQLSTTSAGSTAFTAGDNQPGTPVVVDSALSVLDPLGNPILMATVSITSSLHSGEDVLQFTNDGLTMGDITGSFNALTGTLALNSASGTATDGQWNAALRAVMFTDTAVTPNTATRTVSISITDGTQTSTALNRNITVASVDQTPLISTSGGTTNYVEGDNEVATVAVDSGFTLADSDNTTLASATVSITGNFHSGEDRLAFNSHGDLGTFGDIAASYNAATGELTLNSAGGAATLAQWQAALRAVSYSDTAIIPNTATRTMTFTVNDGTLNSADASKAVNLTATTQTPIFVTGSGGTPTFTADGAGSAPVTIDAGLTITDADSTARPSSALVSIGAGFASGKDLLAFNSTAATGDISANYDPASGVLTLHSASNNATLAQWQAALATVTYADTATETANSSRTINIALSVGDKTATATRTVNVVTAAVTPSPPTPPTPPALTTQPQNLTTLPPPSPFMGAHIASNTPASSPVAYAPDTISTFPMDLDESISNPLIVLDAFAETPDIDAIPVPNTATFSTGDFGERGASNGSGSGTGTHWHGSLSHTSVEALQPIPTPDFSSVSLDLPHEVTQVHIAPDRLFTLALPLSLGAGGLSPGADTHIELRLADGSRLPGWLHFDAVHGTLSGKVPTGQRDLQVEIIVRDAAGHESRRTLTVEFGGRQAPAERASSPGTAKAARESNASNAPIAKPSLAEQFARAHAALHVARPSVAPVVPSIAALTEVPFAVTVEQSHP